MVSLKSLKLKERIPPQGCRCYHSVISRGLQEDMWKRIEEILWAFLGLRGNFDRDSGKTGLFAPAFAPS